MGVRRGLGWNMFPCCDLYCVRGTYFRGYLRGEGYRDSGTEEGVEGGERGKDEAGEVSGRG